MKRGSRTRSILEQIRRVTQRTADNLKKQLRLIAKEKERVTADLDHAAHSIRQTLTGLGFGGAGRNGRAATPAKTGRGKRKRIRRNPAQLKAEAEAIYRLIEGKGSDGAKGSDIRKRHPKVGPDIKGFIQKFSGRKLKTTGRKASMRYFAA